jgi:hypothetical protein
MNICCLMSMTLHGYAKLRECQSERAGHNFQLPSGFSSLFKKSYLVSYMCNVVINQFYNVRNS